MNPLVLTCDGQKDASVCSEHWIKTMTLTLRFVTLIQTLSLKIALQKLKLKHMRMYLKVVISITQMSLMLATMGNGILWNGIVLQRN